MRLPGYTAAEALYHSKYHYIGRGNALVGTDMLPRITAAQSQWVPLSVECVIAQSLCIYNAQGTGYDPSGWCDWYYQNCLWAGPGSPGGGGGGGGLPKPGPRQQ